MSQPLLELRDITRSFTIGVGLSGKRIIKAVEYVSFSIPSDKPVITALVGESGSGKTTIARMILGLLEPTLGDILYKGTHLKRLKKEDWKSYLREVQPIFQDPYSTYNPFYRIERILKIVIRKFGLASSKSEERQIILKALQDIGLRPQDILGRYPHQLSGGERQRLMLARALIMRPRLIVADEPVSMIDVSLRAIFLDQLLSFKENIGTSSLCILHDLNTASYISDNIIVLCKGRIMEEGPAESIVDKPFHPYSKVLIDAIPIPDPDRKWSGRMELASAISEKRAERGCVFAPRCPYVMQVCMKEDPKLAPIGSGRKVACFLY